MADAPLVPTHTVAALEVSPETFAEVTRLLRAAGYDHVFIPVDRGILIDMTGLALLEDPSRCSHSSRHSPAGC